MITRNILQSVFRIQCENKAGSAFTIEKGGMQYIITAKHLFEQISFPSECDIKILINGKYENFHVMIFYHENPAVDAVVLKTNPYIQIAPMFNNETTMNGMILGQDVYFLGFPYNYEAILINFPGENNPVPFVKKAVISGIASNDINIFLDGITNPGFSGGPVCFMEKNKMDCKIAGVITSYHFQKGLVFNEKDDETSNYTRENTGIIYACKIEQVLSIIDKI